MKDQTNSAATSASVILPRALADKILHALDLSQGLLDVPGSRYQPEILAAYKAMRAAMEAPKEDLLTLALSVRTTNVLRSEGVKSITQLTELTARQLLKMPGIGKFSIAEVTDALAARGLRLTSR